jgi:putrescine transport system permease protein
VFSKVRLGVTPEINALASIMVGIVAASVIAGAFMMRRRLLKSDHD